MTHGDAAATGRSKLDGSQDRLFDEGISGDHSDLERLQN